MICFIFLCLCSNNIVERMTFTYVTQSIYNLYFSKLYLVSTIFEYTLNILVNVYVYGV